MNREQTAAVARLHRAADRANAAQVAHARYVQALADVVQLCRELRVPWRVIARTMGEPLMTVHQRYYVPPPGHPPMRYGAQVELFDQEGADHG